MYDYISQTKYNKRSQQFNVTYRPHEIEEAQIVKKYLSETKQSANKYIKSLIHKDLQEKGLIGEKHNGEL